MCKCISLLLTILHEQLIFNSSFVCHNPKGDNSPQIAIPLYMTRYTWVKKLAKTGLDGGVWGEGRVKEGYNYN